MARSLNIILAILLLLPLTKPADAQPVPREYRAVWLTTIMGLDWPRTRATSADKREQQKEELRRELNALQACGINTVLFQTRIRGTMAYPSSIEPKDPAFTGIPGRDPGYDPLQFVIDEAHARQRRSRLSATRLFRESTPNSANSRATAT